MIIEPLYLFVMVVCMVLSVGASAWVKSATRKWSRVPLGRDLTGKDIAEMILRQKGIRGVRIERSRGMLSDHYDPRGKVLRLSPGVYDGKSVTAAGIAAHEVGHADLSRPRLCVSWPSGLLYGHPGRLAGRKRPGRWLDRYGY